MVLLKRIWWWIRQTNRITELQDRVNYLEGHVADWQYYKTEYLTSVFKKGHDNV